MKISEIGGEFAFIRRMTGISQDYPGIVKGAGDDCAVIEYTRDRFLLFTTDMMVENTHFSLKWNTPYQIGKKLMEVNVSDIVAMGGDPRWALISLALTPEVEVEFMDDFYRGLYDSGRRHGVALVGGDTTRGPSLALNLALAGDVEKDLIRYRAGAVPGDVICVTGTLGKSEAGLSLLKKGIDGSVEGYSEPRSRLAWEGRAIARLSHAMIDVSDGLGSEVTHLCEESGTGARIDRDKIPLSRDTIEAANLAGGDPFDYALYGGEDYELAFTVPERDIPHLRKEFYDFSIVGEVLKKDDGIFILQQGNAMTVKKGFDHFE